MSNRKVVIRGAMHDYAEKRPYVRSGRSLRGALELDPSQSGVKCHECGAYKTNLGGHVKSCSGLSPRDYKLKHGLRLSFGLLAPVERSKLATRAAHLQPYRMTGVLPTTPGPRIHVGTYHEWRNEKGLCPAQLLEKIRKIAEDLGHTPTQREIIEFREFIGVWPSSLARALGVSSYNEAMRVCGFEPNHIVRKHSKDILIELLRDARIALCRVPTAADCRPPLLPSVAVFQGHFGSWLAALDAAGFGLVARQREAS